MPRRRHRTGWLRMGSLAAFTVVFVGFAIAAPGFLVVGNIANVVDQSAILGVLAFGMTVVIIGGGGDVITGGIDLSLAGNLGLSAAVFAVLSQSGSGDVLAVVAALASGVAVGFVNAFAVVRLRILPLLATLAVMNICAGVELVLTHNMVVQARSSLLSRLAGDGPFGLPVLAYLLLAIAFVLVLAVQCSPTGLRLYAVGGHREAARAAGLAVERHVGGSYLVSGLCGGIGGVFSAALLNGSTPGSGEMLLSIVVAALLGSVFSRRLVPTIAGTLLAVLFIGFLINGFQLINVSSYWVSGVEGVLILFVVGTTSLVRREMS
ncbi:MAG: ABC transporter permease [Azospirillaceae bacterium]|nr:ABC transporter permease [Azospirillaceae bacterium]